MLQFVSDRYAQPLDIPIIVTENGYATQDEATFTREQIINDTERQEYFELYVKELLDLVKAGVRIEGYQGWSLLDNLGECSLYLSIE